MTNQKQFELLKKSPQELLLSLEYQSKIESVVSTLIKMQRVPSGLKSDLVQEVNAAFLSNRMSFIVKNYLPEKGNLLTYFKRCVYNECIKINIRLQGKEIVQHEPEQSTRMFDMETNPEKTLIDKELLIFELQRLKEYLKLFGRKQARLELLLKLYARVVLSELDFYQYDPGISIEMIHLVNDAFGKAYDKKTDKEVYEIILPVIQGKEKKSRQADSVRKWVNEKVDEIIFVLNSTEHTFYDKESLRNLLMIFYDQSIQGKMNV